jgi:phosphoribosylformylglycinamidine synthase
VNLWQVDIHPAKGQPDTLGSHAEVAARELGIADGLRVAGVQGFLIQSRCDAQSASLWAREYLADPIAQRVVVAKVGDASLLDSGRDHSGKLLHVLYKPGVMDPVAQSTLGMFGGLGCDVEAVRTFRKYWISDQSGDARGVDGATIERLAKRVLSNDSIDSFFMKEFMFLKL